MATLALQSVVAAANLTNPWALALAQAGAAYFGAKIDAQLFGPTVGSLGDRRLTGVDYGTPIPYLWGTWRATAMVMWGKPLVQYSRRSGLKYRADFVCIYGICPRIKAGDPAGALVSKVWFGTNNGSIRLHYDASRDKNFDPPHAILDGTQTAADSLMNADVESPAYQQCIGTVWHRLHVVKYGNQVPAAHSALIQTTVSGTTTLQAVLEDCMELMGVETDRCDFTAVEGVTVRGCSFLAGQQMGDFLQALCEAFAVDLFESGGLIRARPRGSACDWTVEYDDLGVAEAGEDEPRVRVLEHVQCPDDLPLQCTVRYRNADDHFQTAEITATYDAALGNAVEGVDFSFLGLTPGEAEGLGLRHLDEIYRRLRSFEFTLGPKYAGIEPADVLDVPLDAAGGRVERVRVDEIQDRDPLGFFRVVAHRIGTAALSGAGEGGSGGSSGGSGSSGEIATASLVAWSPGSSSPEPFPDDPLAAQPSILVAATWPAGTNDGGVEVWVRKQGDSDRILAGILENRSAIGSATTAMPDGGSLQFETRFTGLSLLPAGSLSSTSQSVIRSSWLAAADGSNYCLLGGELLCFAVASPLGNGAYQVSEVYGGLRGSPTFGHAPGERFVDLTQGDLLRYVVPQLQVATVFEVWCLAPGDDFGAPTLVTVEAPRSNALDPDVLVVSAPTWWKGDMYHTFWPRYTGQDPTPTAYTFQWQRNLNSSGWKGPDGTASTFWYTKDSLTDSLQKGSTLLIRVRAVSTNGSVGGWVATDTLTYVFQSSDGIHAPVRAATTAALPPCSYLGGSLTAISNGALPLQDGVLLAAGESLLVKNQAAGLENGLYVVSSPGGASAPWQLARRSDFDQSAEVAGGTLVAVQEGSANGDSVWELATDDPVTLGSTSLAWQLVGSISGASAPVHFVYGETPSGAVDGSNVSFALAQAPLAGTLQLFLNGLLQNPSSQYSLAGASIVFGAAPMPGDWLAASYHW